MGSGVLCDRRCIWYCALLYGSKYGPLQNIVCKTELGIKGLGAKCTYGLVIHKGD